jgi:hypothetical protein
MATSIRLIRSASKRILETLWNVSQAASTVEVAAEAGRRNGFDPGADFDSVPRGSVLLQPRWWV